MKIDKEKEVETKIHKKQDGKIHKKKDVKIDNKSMSTRTKNNAYPCFRKTGKPFTCGFDFAILGMVEGYRSNVVNRPISWRASQLEAQGSQKSPVPN